MENKKIENMGSIISKINDDIDYYKFLCQEYNEKEQRIYSTYFYWLKDKHEKRLNISYDEYVLKYHS